MVGYELPVGFGGFSQNVMRLLFMSADEWLLDENPPLNRHRFCPGDKVRKVFDSGLAQAWLRHCNRL